MNTIRTEQAFNALPEHTYPPQFPTRVTPRNRLTHDRVAGYMLTEEQDRVDRSRVGNEEPRQYSESHDMAQSLSNSTRSDSSNFGSRVMWRLQSSDEFAPSLSDEILDFRYGGAPRMRYIGSGIAYRSDSLDRDHHIHRASRSNTWAISNFSIAKKDFANEAKNAKKLRQLGQPKKSLYEKIFGLDSKKKKSRVAVAGHRGISGSERKHWSERDARTQYNAYQQLERHNQEQILDHHINIIAAASNATPSAILDYYGSQIPNNHIHNNTNETGTTVQRVSYENSASSMDLDPDFSRELTMRLMKVKKAQGKISFKIWRCGENVKSAIADWTTIYRGVGRGK